MAKPKNTAPAPKTDRATPEKVGAQSTATSEVAGEGIKTVNQTHVVDNTETKRAEPKRAKAKKEESANGTTIVSYV